MNTDQLLQALCYIVGNKNYHFDVIGANRLQAKYKQNIKLPLVLIINTDPDFEPGSHWVALYKCVTGQLEFFDSYGDQISSFNSSYFGFLRQLNPIENCKRIQSLHSKSCGKYCLYYLYKRIQGCAFNAIISKFGSSIRRNECIVKAFYKLIIASNISPLSKNRSLLQCCNSKLISTKRDRAKVGGRL